MNNASPSDQRSEKEIFFAALEQAAPEARAAFLDGACGKNPLLRQRIEKLLAEHFEEDSFLQTAAGEAPRVSIDTIPLREGAGSLIGRYKLLEKVGEGGFGEVWMAEQREPIKRRVALKIVKLGMDSKQVVARFEAERQALALMDHANIAKVFDAGTTEIGRLYFVMELVRGVKITEYCDQNQLTTEERLKLFILVCHAIQHAHQKGIIHRDIKPSNILVTLHDGMPVPKVIDFGIAKATQQELTNQTLFTQFQQFIGTPAYISPEQAEMSGMDIDTRADIYSLGVLLYELLVGQTPFDPAEMLKGGLDALRRTIREKEAPKPSTKLKTLPGAELTSTAQRRHTDPAHLNHQLRGDLDWIVMKCLEKDRTRRYDTANGLAMDIQRYVRNEPVVARPPSTLYKIQKAWQRNKLVFTSTALVALALIAGTGVSTWQAVRATRANHAEVQQRLAAQAAQARAQQKQQEAEQEKQRADAQSAKATASEEHSRRLLYTSDMNLAQQSLKFNNLGRAVELLERNRPKPGEADFRGWEWRYLWQLTRSSALATLTNRPARGSSVSFSPDGTRLAVGWADGRVELWDVPGRRLVRALTDSAERVGRVAFSPVRNLLAATSGIKVVTQYDFDSGRESILWRAPAQGEWRVIELTFSQDGSRLVIYARGHGEDAVWVVNVSSSQIESRHPALVNGHSEFLGAAQLSPDNRRLFLARSDVAENRYAIQCIDLTTGGELWQTERQRDKALTALAVSPDGRLLASGSGFEDPAIRVWDSATGRFVVRLDGHTGWVGKLAFTSDGRRLISASTDQTIRFWDTRTWTEANVLRGHSDEIHSLAISEPAGLVASVSKDGSLMLWKDDTTRAVAEYGPLLEGLGEKEVVPLNDSRVLLLPAGKPPQLVDFKRDAPPTSLPGLASSADFLGWFGTNILCQWNGLPAIGSAKEGTNQILIRELRGADFIQRGAIDLDSGTRPSGFAYHCKRQLLAWTEGTASASVYLANLATPDRHVEFKSDVPKLVPFEFSEDGNYLAGGVRFNSLRVWNVETGQSVVSINRSVGNSTFAAGGRVLVVVINWGSGHEIAIYDLSHPDREPRRFPANHDSWTLVVSPDGGLVASANHGGHVRLFDPGKGELIEDLHAHLNSAFGLAFSADGRRLISTSGGREAVKLWDVGTRQELLTLAGDVGSAYGARWSADGNVILAGAPWQAWRAPSWEEIAAAEAKEIQNKAE